MKSMKTAQDYFDAANIAELDGQYVEANKHYDKALEIQPDFPEAYDNRAGNWSELGDYDKAITDYERVIAYWPDYSGAHDNLARIYVAADDSRFHDKALALHHAKRACDLCQFSEFVPVSTLAAAHAANGQYVEAIAVQETAIKVASGELEADYWIRKLEEDLLKYRHQCEEEKQSRGWLSRLFRILSWGK